LGPDFPLLFADALDTFGTMDEENIESRTPSIERGFISICLDHPWFLRVAALASVVGIPLAFFLGYYFYKLSIHERRLTYHVSPVKNSILRSGQFSELNVSVGDVKITNDLTAATVAIWNAGNEPILHNDILSPIKIVTSNHTPIYKRILARTSRAEADIRLLPPTSLDEVQLDWKILENDDGLVLQVIYGGDSSVKLSVEGSIVGKRAPEEKLATGKWRQTLNVLLGGMMGLAASIAMTIFIETKLIRRKHKAAFVIFAALLVLSGYMVIHLDFTSANRFVTPFGF
jgi:hypothetical protein